MQPENKAERSFPSDPLRGSSAQSLLWKSEMNVTMKVPRKSRLLSVLQSDQAVSNV
jgi:hypothetical protein